MLIEGLLPKAFGDNYGFQLPQNNLELNNTAAFVLYKLTDETNHWKRFGGIITGGFEGFGILIVWGAVIKGEEGLSVDVRSVGFTHPQIKFLKKDNYLYVYFHISPGGPNKLLINSYNGVAGNRCFEYIRSSNDPLDLSSYVEIPIVQG